MDEDRFPSNFSDRFGEEHRRGQHHEHHHKHHHKHHGRPAQLIVFFVEAPTVPQQIDDQLDRIYTEANQIRKVFADYLEMYLGSAVPPRIQRFVHDRLQAIETFSNIIRGEVMKIMAPTAIQPPAGAVTQLVIGDPVGILVAVLEADDSGLNFFPPVGPLQFVVSDPSSTVKQGVAADGVTPTFVDNGSGNTGDVSVQVTDAGNNLVGEASFSVVAGTPPPPQQATQLGVFFVPNSGAASGAGAGATTDAAKAVAAAQVASGTATTVDPHQTKQ